MRTALACASGVHSAQTEANSHSLWGLAFGIYLRYYYYLRLGAPYESHQPLACRAELPFQARPTGSRPLAASRNLVGADSQVLESHLSLRQRRAARLPVSGPKPRWQAATTLPSQAMGTPHPTGGERLPGTPTPPRRSFRTGMETHPGKERAGRLRACSVACCAMPRRFWTSPARCSTESPMRAPNHGRLPRWC